MVLDVGDAVTTATPIIDGFPIQYAVQRIDFGGEIAANRLTSAANHMAGSSSSQDAC